VIVVRAVRFALDSSWSVDLCRRVGRYPWAGFLRKPSNRREKAPARRRIRGRDRRPNTCSTPRSSATSSSRWGAVASSGRSRSPTRSSGSVPGFRAAARGRKPGYPPPLPRARAPRSGMGGGDRPMGLLYRAGDGSMSAVQASSCRPAGARRRVHDPSRVGPRGSVPRHPGTRRSSPRPRKNGQLQLTERRSLRPGRLLPRLLPPRGRHPPGAHDVDRNLRPRSTCSPNDTGLRVEATRMTLTQGEQSSVSFGLRETRPCIER